MGTHVHMHTHQTKINLKKCINIHIYTQHTSKNKSKIHIYAYINICTQHINKNLKYIYTHTYGSTHTHTPQLQPAAYWLVALGVVAKQCIMEGAHDSTW